MLLVVGLWTLALGLLWAVVRGPERWHRSVTLNLRPDAAEPTRSGYALLFWRHVALLLVVGLCALAATREVLGPGDDELLEQTGLAVDLVPADELDRDRLAAELRVLAGPAAVVDDVGAGSLGGDEDADDGETLSVTLLHVSALGLRERAGGGASDGPAPVACVRIETTSYATVQGFETPEPVILASVTPGACDLLPE